MDTTIEGRMVTESDGLRCVFMVYDGVTHSHQGPTCPPRFSEGPSAGGAFANENKTNAVKLNR